MPSGGYTTCAPPVRALEVRVDVLDVDVDALPNGRALERRGRVVGRAHHHRAVAEGHLGMLKRAVGVIPADAGGKTKGFF